MNRREKELYALIEIVWCIVIHCNIYVSGNNTIDRNDNAFIMIKKNVYNNMHTAHKARRGKTTTNQCKMHADRN